MRRGCQRFGPVLPFEKTTLDAEEERIGPAEANASVVKRSEFFAYDVGRKVGVRTRNAPWRGYSRHVRGSSRWFRCIARRRRRRVARLGGARGDSPRELSLRSVEPIEQRADAGATGAEDETVHKERVRVQFESPRSETRSRRPCSKYDDRRLESFPCAPNPGVRRAVLVRRVNRPYGTAHSASCVSARRRGSCDDGFSGEPIDAVSGERHKTSEVWAPYGLRLSQPWNGAEGSILEAPRGATRSKRNRFDEYCELRSTHRVERSGNSAPTRGRPRSRVHRSGCQRIAASRLLGSASANWLRTQKTPRTNAMVAAPSRRLFGATTSREVCGKGT